MTAHFCCVWKTAISSRLNLTAHYILSCTDGRSNVAKIADALVEKYHISSTDAVQDILSLYEKMTAEKIVAVVGNSIPHNKKESLTTMEESLEKTVRSNPMHLGTGF